MKKMTRLILIMVLSLFSTLAFSQDKNVTGTVTDSPGAPLPGVTVKSKRSKNNNRY